MDKLDNLIETLIGQHRNLQEQLASILELSPEDEKSVEIVKSTLEIFSTDLEKHLELEKDVFYPELLKRMEAKGGDVSAMREFINQMDEIGVTVRAFAEGYKNLSLEGGQFETFKKELKMVIAMQNLRIETEETGVYGYWKLYE